jgi:hypothetical protein
MAILRVRRIQVNATFAQSPEFARTRGMGPEQGICRRAAKPDDIACPAATGCVAFTTGNGLVIYRQGMGKGCPESTVMPFSGL